MEFCLYLAKNKTEVATQMVIHNIPHIFQRTKPIHTDCVSDPSTLNWGAVELHDVKYSGISALSLYGRWGKMIMASFRGADISPQEARASLWDQTFVNHQTANRVGRWWALAFKQTFISAALPTCPALPAIILALSHQSWEEASFGGVHFYAASIRSTHISGYLPLCVVKEAYVCMYIWSFLSFFFYQYRTTQDIKKWTNDLGFKNEMFFRTAQISPTAFRWGARGLIFQINIPSTAEKNCHLRT